MLKTTLSPRFAAFVLPRRREFARLLRAKFSGTA